MMIGFNLVLFEGLKSIKIKRVNFTTSQPVPEYIYTENKFTKRPPGQRRLGQRPPEQRLPLDRDPLDRHPLDKDFPWTETTLTETPGERPRLDRDLQKEHGTRQEVTSYTPLGTDI